MQQKVIFYGQFSDRKTTRNPFLGNFCTYYIIATLCKMSKLKHFIQCKFTIILHSSVVCVFLVHVYPKLLTDLLSTIKRHYRPLTVSGKGIIGWLKKNSSFHDQVL